MAAKAPIPPHWHAAAGGDTAKLRTALVGADLEWRPPSNGATALQQAVRGSHTEAVELLLNKGADPNTCDINGMSVLSEAAGKSMLGEAAGKSTELVRLLLAHGANPNPAGCPDGSPLHRAVALTNEPTLVSLLVRHGAAVNALDGEGRTPLVRAAAYISSTMLQALLAAGADVNAVDRDGVSALQHARKCNTSVACELLRAGAKEYLEGAALHQWRHDTLRQYPYRYNDVLRVIDSDDECDL